MGAASRYLRSLSRIHVIYVATWAGLATGAMLYIAGFALSALSGAHTKELYLAGSQTIALTAPQSDLRQSRAEAIAELANRSASTFRNDVQEVREQVNALMLRLETVETNANKINKKIAGLGVNFSPLTTAALPAPSARSAISSAKLTKKMTGGSQNPKHVAALPPGIIVRTVPLPDSGFGDTSERPPVLMVAMRPMANRIIFGVHLGSGNSIDMVRSEWNIIRARYATYLSELEGRYLKEPAANKTAFQLIAGPFTNAAEAIRLCVRIQAGKSFCKATIFAGKSL